MAAEPVMKYPKEPVRVACAGECTTRTFHDVLARADISDTDGPVEYWAQYDILRCRGCGEISFRKDWQISEDVDVDDEGNYSLISHEELFPGRVDGSKTLWDAFLLPDKVGRIYKETRDALAARLPVLAGIGIRALVEAVCRDKGATGRDLEKRIDDLVRLEALTTQGAEILHGTRLLGNRAAHEVEPLGADVLNAAMAVAEHLLQSVYLLPEHASMLPKRVPRPVPTQVSQAAAAASGAGASPPTPARAGQHDGLSPATEPNGDAQKTTAPATPQKMTRRPRGHKRTR